MPFARVPFSYFLRFLICCKSHQRAADNLKPCVLNLSGHLVEISVEDVAKISTLIVRAVCGGRLPEDRNCRQRKIFLVQSQHLEHRIVAIVPLNSQFSKTCCF